MKQRPILFFGTRVGTFCISVSEDGRFHPVFDNESLGSYNSAAAAAAVLAGGHTFSTNEVSDTAVLGIPVDVHEWHRVQSN